MTESKFYITSTYLFFSWPDSTDFSLKEKEICEWCHHHEIKGLLLIGEEGFNGTLACKSKDILQKLKDYLKSLVLSQDEAKNLDFKDSTSNFIPFRRMKVKIKEEIVTLGKTEIRPKAFKDESHLSPKDWNDFIKTKKPTVLDVRNDYEMEIGKFKSAKEWKMTEFTEFPKLVSQLDLDKDAPVLMYCTGGIRCEKASIEMKNQGFKNVYQLDGGILNYIEQFPNDEFEGECFVFDHRVSVDQNLSPTKKYALCVHCGQPALFKPFECVQCGDDSVVCEKCLDDHVETLDIRTCSKNCRHHFQMGHKNKRVHLDSKREYRNQKIKTKKAMYGAECKS